MTIYVDELPNSCQECPFCEYFEKDAHGKGKHEVACYFNGSLGNILYGNQTSPKTCPLQSLADYTKQVRKEICDKIRENAISHNDLEVDMYYITPQQLYEIEKGETNG